MNFYADISVEKFLNFIVKFNFITIELHLAGKYIFFYKNVENDMTNKVSRVKLAHQTSLYLQIRNTNGWTKVNRTPGNFMFHFFTQLSEREKVKGKILKNCECFLISPPPYDNFSKRGT